MKTFKLNSQTWHFEEKYSVDFMYKTKTWYVNYVALDGLEFGKPCTLSATRALNFAIANGLVAETESIGG